MSKVDRNGVRVLQSREKRDHVQMRGQKRKADGRVLVRQQQPSRAQEMPEDEQIEDAEDERDDFATRASSSSFVAAGRSALDLIASSTSHSSNAIRPAKVKPPKPAAPPAAAASKADSAKKRTVTTFSTPAATAPSATSSPVPAAALPSAPAATAAGSLFTDIRPALDADLLHVVSNVFGFKRMTPVQAQTIPTFLSKDVSVQSYTGSGKTLAFVLPMMQILINKFSLPTDISAVTAGDEHSRAGEINIDSHTIGALILSPTRELANQICSVIAPFVFGGAYANARLHKFKLIKFIGGSDMMKSETEFITQGGNILVATPGRLASALTNSSNSTLRNAIKLSDLRVLILDEADRLLDLGFEKDINFILSRLPKTGRRTGLFSATQTKEIKELKRAGLQGKYATIEVQLEFKKKKEIQENNNKNNTKQQNGSDAKAYDDDDDSETLRTQVTPNTLQNHYIVLPLEHKFDYLIHFILTHSNTASLPSSSASTPSGGTKLIIFFLTGDEVDYFSRLLPRLQSFVSRGWKNNVFALRGGKQGMEQKKREKQLEAFTNFKPVGNATQPAILLATDVAARGLDVPDVDWIIQFDPPKDASLFVHRIGRTARAGKKGNALVFLTKEEKAYAKLIQGMNVPMSETTLAKAGFEPPNELHSWSADRNVNAFKNALQEQQKPPHAIETMHKQKQQENKLKKTQQQQPQQPSSSASSSSAAVVIPSLLREVRYLNLDDRLLMEKGLASYTSFVDGYKQHLLPHVLPFSKLDFANLARCFGILYLPKMPDIKHLMTHTNFDTCPIKPRHIRFKDTKLQAEHEKKEAALHEKNAEEQKQREAKEKERQERLKAAGAKRRKKKLHEVMREEWDELQHENRLLKKLKQGKISKQQFEIEIGERRGKKLEDTNKHKQHSDDSDDDEEFSDDSDADSDEDAEPPKKKAKVAAAAAGGSKGPNSDAMCDDDD